MAPPVIQYDYDFSPYGQKTRLILEAAGVPFQRVDQPIVLPRPDLTALGITYRRIPVLAVGKDVYADSAAISSVITKSLGKIPQHPSDEAFKVWGDNLFAEALSIISLELLTPDFVKDREAIFPALNRPDLKTLRPSGLAGFRARLTQVENEFLGQSSGPFLYGSQLSLADIHMIWPIKWAFEALGLGKEPGFEPAHFPKITKFLEALPKVSPQAISADDAAKAILGSEYTSKTPQSVNKESTYGLSVGTEVTVESFDSTPGSYPQYGKLVATDVDEVVIELKNGIRLHFPAIGYLVRDLANSPAKL